MSVARKKLVFFSMPFGTKVVDDQLHDFDEIWHKLLQPAVPDDWEHKRIDEVTTPGTINEQFKYYLRTADVVVFDLTAANPNVLYELGIRDVFAPDRRVLVAREGTVLPFNVSQERVNFYPVDLAKAIEEQFPSKIRKHIFDAVGDAAGDLHSAPKESRLTAQLRRATTLPSLVALWEEWKTYNAFPVDPLLELAKAFTEQNRPELALQVAERAYKEEPNYWEVARIFGWYLRRANKMERATSLFNQALALNANDVESMGMLGGIYKREAARCFQENSKKEGHQWFEQAKNMYLRALEVDQDNIYHLVNVGALTLIEGESENFAYRKIVDLIGVNLQKTSTWDLLALGEAYVALGKLDDALEAYSMAIRRTDFTIEMRDSASEQLILLTGFGLTKKDADAVRSVLMGERIRPGKKIVLIHLSDIHFGKKLDGTEMHRFRASKSPLSDQRTLAEHIVSECGEEKKDDIGIFIIISGDIAFQAIQEEYEQARLFIKSLITELGIEPEQIVIVPGNHDVNWKLSDHQTTQRFDEFLIFAKNVFESKFETLYPFIKWDFGLLSPRPTPEQILSIHEAPEHGIVFVGFNTCVMEDHELHFGAIGKEQVKLAESALTNIDPSWIRVAVMHHHVLPLESRLSLDANGAEMDGTIVRDYGLVERELHALGFDMVLHGHKHEPGIRISQLVHAFSTHPRKSLIVCGAGSTGVEKVELPDDWGNHFAIYRIQEGIRRAGSSFVDIEWRELPYNDIHRKWVPRGFWKIEG